MVRPRFLWSDPIFFFLTFCLYYRYIKLMKDENALAAEAAKGDPRAFGSLVRPYRRGMLNLAYRMTGNEEEAKEIIQEALIKSFRYLHRFDRKRSFKNWLYKITANASRDFLRKKIRHQTAVNESGWEVQEETTPESRFLNKEIKAKIDQCLQDLSPKEKLVYLLRERQGFSVKETAQITGASSASVRTHLSRARKKIKSRFVSIYGKPPKENKNAV